MSTDEVLDHAVHAYKVACVARMAMETHPDGVPTIEVLNASIREGVRQALLAVALEDAKRLDWLEVMANRRGGILLHDGSESGRLGLGLRPGTMNRTLRQAINAAMSSEPRHG